VTHRLELVGQEVMGGRLWAYRDGGEESARLTRSDGVLGKCGGEHRVRGEDSSGGGNCDKDPLEYVCGRRRTEASGCLE
jgi:hypothetical protein